MGLKWVNNYITEIDFNLKCLDEDYKNLKLYYKSYIEESNDVLSSLSNLTHMQIALLVIKLKCDYIIYEVTEALKNS